MGNVFTFFGIAKPKKMFVYTQPYIFLKRSLLNDEW